MYYSLNKLTQNCKDIEDAAAKNSPYFRIDIDGVESVRKCLVRDLTQRATIKV